jgi:hypothetical protein
VNPIMTMLLTCVAEQGFETLEAVDAGMIERDGDVLIHLALERRRTIGLMPSIERTCDRVSALRLGPAVRPILEGAASRILFDDDQRSD